MIEAKVEIKASLISIKDGKVVHEHTFDKFDFDDDTQLKRTLRTIYKTIKEMNLAQEIVEEKEHGNK
jgi:hypothetical protein